MAVTGLWRLASSGTCFASSSLQGKSNLPGTVPCMMNCLLHCYRTFLQHTSSPQDAAHRRLPATLRRPRSRNLHHNAHYRHSSQDPRCCHTDQVGREIQSGLCSPRSSSDLPSMAQNTARLSSQLLLRIVPQGTAGTPQLLQLLAGSCSDQEGMPGTSFHSGTTLLDTEQASGRHSAATRHMRRP